MNMFADLAQNTDIQDGDKDVLGGGYSLPESGLYNATVKVAYATTAASGAVAINIVLTLENGTEVREALWVRSGTAKGGANFYVDKQGNKKFLPGYATANTLCEVVAGKGLPAVTMEEKVLNLYSAEAGKEVPTKVPVVMDVVGQPLKVGLIRVLENKNIKDASGNYVPSAETRESVTIDKIFNTEGLTKTEKQAGETEPKFAAKWAEKWTGEVRDKRTIKDGQQSQATAATGGFTPKPAAAPTAAPAVNSLFG